MRIGSLQQRRPYCHCYGQSSSPFIAGKEKCYQPLKLRMQRAAKCVTGVPPTPPPHAHTPLCVKKKLLFWLDQATRRFWSSLIPAALQNPLNSSAL